MAEQRLQGERDALAKARADAEAQIAEGKEAVDTLEKEQAQAEIKQLRADLDAAEKARDEAQAASVASREAQQKAEQRAVVAESRLEDAQTMIAKLIERIPTPPESEN